MSNLKERKKKIDNEIKQLNATKKVFERTINSKNRENESLLRQIDACKFKIEGWNIQINLGGIPDCKITDFDTKIKINENNIKHLEEKISENNAIIDSNEAKIREIDLNITQQKEKYDKITEEHEGELSDWAKHILWTESNTGFKTQENAINFFKWYPKYLGKLKYDIVNSVCSFDGKLLDDNIITRGFADYEHNVGMSQRSYIKDGMILNCVENEINPFIETLDALELWDGSRRLENFFIKYLGLDKEEHRDYVRHITKNFFYGMMKRIYEPGCPMDFMPILQDEHQGSGKSKIVGRLLESINCWKHYVLLKKPDLGDKDKIQEVQKAMVAYVDEMKEFMKSDVDTCKEFVTCQVDRGRFAYSKFNYDYPRHWCLIANTNLRYFLKDYSNDSVERRYPIIECNLEKSEVGGDMNDRSTRAWWDKNLPFEECRQILAEALYYYKNEPEYDYQYLSNDELNLLLEIQQRHKTAGSNEALNDWLQRLINGKYILNEAGEFNDINDFLQQIEKHDTIYYKPDANELMYSYIKSIPAVWVQRFLQRKKELNGKSVNYVLSMLDKNHWYRKQNKYYNGVLYDDIYYRKS